jgi:hypothetical protein
MTGGREHAGLTGLAGSGAMQPFLNFEMPGFTRVAEDTWADNDRTLIGTNYFDIPPDLPVGFDDLPLLQRATALMAAQQGATLVEADVVEIGGLPALRQVLKVRLPDQPTGQAFLGSFTIPRANCSAVLRVQAAEGQPTGIREALVLGQVGPEAFFQPHPHVPDVNLPLPFHIADDPAYDAQFPRHPLSCVRRVMAQLAQQTGLQPVFTAQPPFTG